ncbi:hypothetical protein Are01nite_10160 [Actinoplanes regularis]|nr:hypothetical protein Are01nite_10160 [Actinoplanes regularis]
MPTRATPEPLQTAARPQADVTTEPGSLPSRDVDAGAGPQRASGPTPPPGQPDGVVTAAGRGAPGGLEGRGVARVGAGLGFEPADGRRRSYRKRILVLWNREVRSVSTKRDGLTE